MDWREDGAHDAGALAGGNAQPAPPPATMIERNCPAVTVKDPVTLAPAPPMKSAEPPPPVAVQESDVMPMSTVHWYVPGVVKAVVAAADG